MDERILSDKQRSWLGHVEACVAAGGSMKAYANKHDLDLQTVYLWKGRLKKLGLVDTEQERPTAGTAARVAGSGAVKRRQNLHSIGQWR